MASKEYLYRVKNSTPGAPDRYVRARLPGQAVAFVAANVLTAELCDGIAGAEAVLRGFTIESALGQPAQPEPDLQPQPQLIEQASELRAEAYRHQADSTYPPEPSEADAAPAVEVYPDPDPAEPQP
jgi:hypothetical protein